jgi:hypothetical protein
MRFVTPSQNIAEYRHQQMPIYETIAAVGATTIVGSLTVGGLAGAAATAGAGALAAYGVNQALGSGGGGGGGGGGMPTYQPFTTEQQMQNAGKLFQQAQQSGIDFARAGTQANIRNQDRVTPGSSQQRQLAQNQINQYIQGQIPLDVQQNINRQVAQNLGGGFNLFSGGGQAPQNFARNIGQTSLGLSQFGLSAAPTWQQLANQMVVSPSVGMQGQLQAQQTAAGLGMQNAENAYQSQANQFGANQIANQNQAQMIMQGANTGMDLYKTFGKSNYYNSLTPSMQAQAATLGGIPAYTNTPYLNSLGYSAGETPSFGTGA